MDNIFNIASFVKQEDLFAHGVLVIMNYQQRILHVHVQMVTMNLLYINIKIQLINVEYVMNFV